MVELSSVKHTLCESARGTGSNFRATVRSLTIRTRRIVSETEPLDASGFRSRYKYLQHISGNEVTYEMPHFWQMNVELPN